MLGSLCTKGPKKRRGLPLIPQGTAQAPTKERTSNPGPCGTQQLKQSWGSQRLGLWVPPAAHHYLHEDPKEQGSHPDLDGQLSHGADGVAPAAATGAVRGSHGSAGAARQSLGCEGGALQAAGGSGRRARGGGGGEGSAPISRSGLPDTQTTHRPLRIPLAIALIGGASGTPCLPAPLSRVQFPCLGLAPRTRDPGREAWGSPRCRRRGLPERAAWLPKYWAAPGLCARLHALPAAGGRCAPPLHPATPALLLSAPSTHTRTWA